MAEDSFGSLLRAARLGARMPNANRPLTQQALANAIGEELGIYNSPTSQAVSYWERGKHQPEAKDRDVLFALVKVLVQYGGLLDLKAANRLLEIGGYAALDPREQQAILGIASSQKEHSAPPEPEPAPISPSPNPASMLHQLRAPSQDFVGRAAEIEQIVGALRGAPGGAVAGISGVRGMGGIGKTELAYVVAEQVRDLFGDAQLLIDLLGSRDDGALTPIQALQSVIRAFHREAQLPDDERELVALYRSALAGRRVLILADDARDTAQVRPLIPPPGSALLITTRFRFEIPGMASLDLDALPEAEAIELLQAINPAIPAPIAGEIARLCGRLPLALRVVAGLTKKTSRTLAEYVALLRDERARLSRMVDKRANLDVEASLSLSYRLLEAEDQRVLAQLGVFAAGFDRRAVESVVVIGAGVDLVDRLDALYEANLLEYDRDQDRYSLHELVRVFALARLEAEEERVVRLRHARYYIQVAAETERLYLSGNAGVAVGLALFDAERVQLDAARAWLQQYADTPDVDELLIADADATAHIGDLRYMKRDGRIPQIETALAAARRTQNRAAQSVFLGNLGLAYAAMGKVRQAIDFYQQDLIIAREIGDRRGEGNSLGNLGNAYAASGEVGKAIEYYQQHLTIAREIGDRRGEGTALGNLGVAYKNLGEVGKAIEYYQQHLTIAREIGDRRGEGTALGNLGNAYADLGELHRAIEYHNQILVISHEISDRRGEGAALGNLGNAYAALGAVRQAIDFYEQRLVIARAIGDRRGEGNTIGNLGNAYADLGEPHRAIEYYQQHLTIAREIGSRRGEGAALGNLGNAYADLGEPHRAIEYHNQTLVISREIGDRRGEGAALGNLGNAYADLGEPHRAIEYHNQALVISREIGDRQGEAETSWNYGLALARQNQPAQALPLLEASLAFYHELGHPRATDMAATLDHVRQHGTLPPPDQPSNALEGLPDAVRQAIEQRDTQALQSALEALTAEEAAAIVERLERAGIIEGQSPRSPEDLFAALPEPVRRALERGDEAAYQAALEALPAEERRAVELATAEIMRAAQPDPCERFDALLRDIARVAVGDAAARQPAETGLERLEQGGWMLREPVRRIWAGERDAAALVEGLDEQDRALVERVLELIALVE